VRGALPCRHQSFVKLRAGTLIMATLLRRALYWSLRFRDALEVSLASVQISTETAGTTSLFRALFQVWRGAPAQRKVFVETVLDEMSKPASFVATLTGNSMAPTLNAHVTSPFRPGERLVIRRLSRWTGSMDTVRGEVTFYRRPLAYRGDIVVVKDPEDGSRRFVRRVVALEGDELVRDEEETSQALLRLERGQYWVLRDNDNPIEEDIQLLRERALEAGTTSDDPQANAQKANAPNVGSGAALPAERLPLAQQINLLRILRRDSRDFGPVTSDHIIGRVIYAIRNEVDHGRVRNSGLSMMRDDVILAVELQQLGMC
jgi:signal peptidase I